VLRGAVICAFEDTSMTTRPGRRARQCVPRRGLHPTRHAVHIRKEIRHDSDVSTGVRGNVEDLIPMLVRAPRIERRSFANECDVGHRSHSDDRDRLSPISKLPAADSEWARRAKIDHHTISAESIGHETNLLEQHRIRVTGWALCGE
jgi:hypothetical protein